MSRRFPALAFVVAGLIASYAELLSEVFDPDGEGTGSRLEQYHQLSLESALETDGLGLQFFEPRLQSEFGSQWRPNLYAFLSARIQADAKDELEPGRPDQSTADKINRRWILGDRAEAELREFYLRYDHPRFDLTLGKQQVVWGQADGLRLLDVVNPFDFRKFILEDFVDSRIPLWSLNLEVPLDGLFNADSEGFDASMTTLQLIWIPDRTYHRLPDLDAAYGFSSPLFVPQAPAWINVHVESAERPNHFILDSDVGARLTHFWKGWDLSLNYLYHYDDIPGLYRRIGVIDGRLSAIVTPSYVRSHVFGMTGSATVSDFTFRVEAAGFLDRPFPTSSLRHRDGVVREDEYGLMVGLDYFGWRNTFLSGQLFQSWLTHNNSLLFREQGEFTWTQMARHELLDGRLDLELMWLQDLTRGDGLLRPKIGYDFNDRVSASIGFNFFYGDQDGLFGQFKDRTHVVTKWILYF